MTKENNTVALDEIWDVSTSIPDLKKSVEKLEFESDLNTNLFFLTSKLDPIKDEYKLTYDVYNYLKKNIEKKNANKKVTVTADMFGLHGFNKPKLEKAVHRLSQLGIVSDWIVEDFFKVNLQIEFDCIDADQLQANLERTIKKYDPNFKLDDIDKSNNPYYQKLCERREEHYDDTQFVLLVLLVWSYDHFVYNRRQSLKTVYEQCCELASEKIDGIEFKNRLEGYFKYDKSSDFLHHLAENTADTSIWLSVFFEDEDETGRRQLISKDKLSTLKDQLSRFLESYKDNVCLDYLSGVIRLAFDQFDDADGERRMASSLDQLMHQDRQSDVEILIRDTLKLKPLLSMEAQSLFAKLVYEKFSELRILKVINAGFGDPYSYNQLLEPLVSRLEKITNLYIINAGFGDPYSYNQLLAPLALRLEIITKLHKGIKW